MDIDTTANYKLGGAQQHDSVRLDRKRTAWTVWSESDELDKVVSTK